MQYREEYGRRWNPPDPQQLKKLVGALPAFIIILFLIIALFTTFFTVAQDEVGVVTRFGKYVRIAQPGLHFKFPFGVEQVQKPQVQRIMKEEFGFRTTKPGVRTTYQESLEEEEALMLCGDLNSAMVEWIVQYKIKDPVAYLFNVRDARKTIRDVSEATIRNIIGDSSVDEVLTIRRIEISNEGGVMMQKMLDSYNIGIHVVTVKLQDVNPPEEVKPAFNEVNEAKQDRERFINEAWQEYNRVVPRAKGEAQQMIEMANAYAVDRVNTAKGKADRFISVWEEYQNAQDVTRRRIFLETMKEVLPKIGRKIIIDQSQSGVLPLLPLSEELPRGGKK